ncbi:PKD domain-containing protein, partial [Sediminibacterium soli]|uniref:PKD domain-containing protein n=1 Tax=Sediminibacterium soli TaxID=2698829 RepID=UPI00137AA888
VCATANSGTLSLSGYTGSVSKWQTSIDNGNTWTDVVNTTNTISFSNLSVTTAYRAMVASGVCPAQGSNTVIVTVLQPVTPANAGPDQTLCAVTSATLAGNTPASGSGTWTFVSGPTTPVFTNANNPTTTVNGLTTGTYRLAWNINNGACAVSQDFVDITVVPQTNPGTLASDLTVCATANSGSFTLTGYSTNILNWESSTDNGNTWNTISNTTANFSFTNLTTTTRYRVNVKNSVCPALYSNVVTANVLQAVTVANAGADEIVINGVTSIRLNGNVPGSGSGKWTQVSGPTTVTISNSADPRTTVGNLEFNAGSPPTDGVYLMRWTISNGACASSSDTMKITVQPPTDPGRIGPDAVVCTGANTGTLVLTDYLGTILRWETSVDYGVTWSAISSTVNANQNTYTYINLTTTTLFRALVQNGVGVPKYSGIAATVTVLDLVTPSNAGPDQSLCNTTTATLAGNTPTSGTGKWTFVSGPTTPTIVDPLDHASVVNGMGIGTYRFAWTISNGICSDSRDEVDIVIHPPTLSGTLVADATVCATANSGTLSLTGYRGSVLNWEYSINNGTSWTNIVHTTDTYNFTNLTATTLFRAQVKNQVCPALYSNNVIITALPAVTTANAGPDQSICNTSGTTLAANTPSSGTGKWTAEPGNPTTVTFTDDVNPTTTITGLAAGTYKLRWTISSSLCTASSDIVEISVYPPTVPGTLIADATVCATANSATLSLSGYTGSILNWESSTNNGATW